MIKFLDQYLKDIDLKLESRFKYDWREILENHREMIKFMQHERLIHLLVTLFFGLLFILMTMFLLISPTIIILLVEFLLIILLIPYIFHYFRLENGVQKLYKINELIRKKI